MPSYFILIFNLYLFYGVYQGSGITWIAPKYEYDLLNWVSYGYPFNSAKNESTAPLCDA